MGYTYHHGHTYPGMEAMAAIVGVIMVVFAVIAVVSLLLYILRSIGLMTLASNRRLNNSWLAWIPVVGVYTLGAIVDDIGEKEGGKSVFRYLLLGGSVLSMLLSGVSNISGFYQLMTNPEDWMEYGMQLSAGTALGGMISIAYLVITLVALNKLFQCYKPESATAWTVLCFFFPFLQSIFPFALRNSEPRPTHYPPYGNYPPPAGGPSQPGSSYGNNPYGQGNYPPSQGYAPNPGGYNTPQQIPSAPEDGGYRVPYQGGPNAQQPSVDTSPQEDDHPQQ